MSEQGFGYYVVTLRGRDYRFERGADGTLTCPELPGVVLSASWSVLRLNRGVVDCEPHRGVLAAWEEGGIALQPYQVVAMAVSHVRHFVRLIREGQSGAKRINMGECRRYARLWTGIWRKGGGPLTPRELQEVEEARLSGDYDHVILNARPDERTMWIVIERPDGSFLEQECDVRPGAYGGWDYGVSGVHYARAFEERIAAQMEAVAREVR